MGRWWISYPKLTALVLSSLWFVSRTASSSRSRQIRRFEVKAFYREINQVGMLVLETTLCENSDIPSKHLAFLKAEHQVVS